MLDRFVGEVLRKTMLNMISGESCPQDDYLNDIQMGDDAAKLTTDLARTSSHEPITWDLIQMVEHSCELKELLCKSISRAMRINPDRRTNPVYSLESYYSFIDWSARAMPWEITPTEEYSMLYDRIDQSMGCFYFICDQPLPELEEKGYYHNSLMYHEPFRSWLVKFTSGYGAFLNTEESWREEFLLMAREDPSFRLDEALYEDRANWRCFNDFFARKLCDASVRPIDAPEDDAVVVSPADAVPQGLWRIDEAHRVSEDPEIGHGIAIKTGTLRSVASLLGESRYAESFSGGTLTHTTLDVNDYHRFHFPVSGTVLEVSVIPADDAPGGVIVWDSIEGRYKEYGSDQFGWQSLETRGVVIMKTVAGALAAIVPVGMCEVNSVNFEDSVKAGAEVRKGDPLGYFLFGGSDIIMIFDRKAAFRMTADSGRHLQMGKAYGLLPGET